MNTNKRFLMLFFITVAAIFQSGCKSGIENMDSANSDESSHIGLTYDEDTYELESFSIASLESADTTYLDPPPKLNSSLISTIGNERTEIALKLHTQNPGIYFNDPSIWALFIRTSPNPIGIKYFDELNINLFYNHRENRDICCHNTLPFEDFDLADESYVPVGGWVLFESDKQGNFSLDFQKETEVHSKIFEGQIVNVKGCWNIAGEGGVAGCELEY